MKKILVIGGGAMGSAFTIPCLENKNKVTITEPYSKAFIRDLSSKSKFHSSLKINLPKSLKFRKFSTDLLKEKFDLIVIALSLSGINFISKELKKLKSKKPNWLPPQPFLNVGIYTRLAYERFKARSET